MDEKKRELILKASAIYMRLGIKSVTMDEMARQLAVSKKTLYQYVKDKNELVELCVQIQHEEEQLMIQQIVESTENAIEQMLKISRFIIEELRQVHPSIFFDMSKYHPSALNMMQCHKDEFICGCIEQNLINGIKQGLYRKKLNPKVISSIYVAMIDFVLSGESYNDTKIQAFEVYSELFRYHIRGIASEMGLEYLVELIKNDDSLSYGM